MAALILFLIWISPFAPNPLLLFQQPASKISSESNPQDWATSAGTPTHIRFKDVTASFQRKVRWSLTLDELTGSVPAVVENTLYIGDYFKVRAVDARSGKKVWTAEASGPVGTSPAVAGNLVFFGLLDGKIVALDRHSGKLAWEYQTDNYIDSSPTVVDGILHIGSGDGGIYALDAQNGELIWKKTTAGNIRLSPAVADGMVYAVSDMRKLYCLSAKTGARRLLFHLYRNIVDSPVVANNMVYFATKDGRLYTLRHNTRQIPGAYMMKRFWTQLWFMRLPIPPPPPQAGAMWRFSPNDLRGGFSTSPALASNRLFIGDRWGWFYAVDAVKGTLIYETKVETGITTSPLVLGDKAFFGTKTGCLYAVNQADGKRLWKLSLGSPITGSLVHASGLLFVLTQNGKLHAIE